ncbi:MAG: hypothetical protein JSR77_17725 [Planctomycetes bacterium]|nr:hypothetical protein [Planctomycetota bacterium]
MPEKRPNSTEGYRRRTLLYWTAGVAVLIIPDFSGGMFVPIPMGAYQSFVNDAPASTVLVVCMVCIAVLWTCGVASHLGVSKRLPVRIIMHSATVVASGVALATTLNAAGYSFKDPLDGFVIVVLPLLACFLLSTTDLIRLCLSYSRLSPNSCKACGYNVIGLQTPQCPECGARLPTTAPLPQDTTNTPE